MKRFCEPDPYSRSPDDGGARLVLLDEHRDWGWRVVNHGKYRERARLASKNAREVEEGRNRDRMNQRTADDRRSPPVTAADHPSYANADSNKKEERERPVGRRAGSRTVPDDFAPDLAFARSEIPDIDAEAEAAKFRDCEFTKPHSDWVRTWRTWIRRAKESGRYVKSSTPPVMAGPTSDGKPPRWQ